MSRSREFNLGNLVNLITLMIGLSIGFIAGMFYQPHAKVQAQATAPAVPEVQEITPTIMAGSIGTNLVMAHEVDTDQLVVNGYDVMKLQQGVINYLATRLGAESADFQNIVNSARSGTVHRIKAPSVPVPTPPAAARPEKKP